MAVLSTCTYRSIFSSFLDTKLPVCHQGTTKTGLFHQIHFIPQSLAHFKNINIVTQCNLQINVLVFVGVGNFFLIFNEIILCIEYPEIGNLIPHIYTEIRNWLQCTIWENTIIARPVSIQHLIYFLLMFVCAMPFRIRNARKLSCNSIRVKGERIF